MNISSNVIRICIKEIYMKYNNMGTENVFNYDML